METKTKEKSKNKVKSILINPIGGLFYNSEIRQYIYQRPVFSGIYIDSLTIDISIPLADMLKVIGLKTYSTRLLNKVYRGYNDKWTNAMGSSQQPRYRECCIEYLKSMSLPGTDKDNMNKEKFVPDTIYNDGDTTLDKDFNARINYAKWLGVDLMVTIDVTTYANDIGLEAVCNKIPGSEELGGYIIDEVAKRTRNSVRGVSFMSETPELRHNSLPFPSVILRCGSTADVRTASLLTQGWYRQWISLGIFAGIYKYLQE